MENRKFIFWSVLIGLNLVLIAVVIGIYLYRTSDRAPNISVGPVGIWRTDERLGYSHIPNSSGVHKTSDFEVTYTIGPSGERKIPLGSKPKKNAGEILFLGGSLTFGHGVEDNEPFPALLATKYWRDSKIKNKAVMGWGTAHAYLTLIDELKGQDLPEMVIYGFIPDHVVRNYIRRDWVAVMDKYGRKHPHFELINGELEFQGVIGLDESLKSSAEVTKKELALTVALLTRMQALCMERSIPFVVLLLPKLQPLQDGIISTLRGNNISYLDLSNTRPQGFKHDPHPNARDHARLAREISRSFITKALGRFRAAR